MAKKMYYTEAEATTMLGLSPEDLAKLVTDQKLRVFHDGPKQMYKAEEVDALAGGDSTESAEIELAPAPQPEVQPIAEAPLSVEQPAPIEPPAAMQPANPADTTQLDVPAPPDTTKDDTAISTEGISIFDEEDLDVESADPMAKTSITPGMEDQVSLEGIGSGSGLLDLTRESDDTSLGEALDHIDMAGALDTALGGEPGTATASYAPAEVEPDAPAPVAEQPVAPVPVAPADSSAGLFGGLVVACCLLMLVLGAVVVAALLGIVPTFLEVMKNNLLIALGASVGLVVVSAVVGLLIGKSTTVRRQVVEQGESRT